MHIKGLKLQNFRCYDELDIDFDERLTVIVGENGRGKTAIFDALAIGLAPFLRAFGEEGRHPSIKDVRRVPVYGEDGVHIVSMRSKHPTKVDLTGEARGEELQAKITIDETNKIEEEAQILVTAGKQLAEEVAAQQAIVLPAFAYYGTSRIWVDSSLMEHYEDSLEERNIGYRECLEPSSSYNTFGQWFEHVTRQAQQEEQEGAVLQRNQLIKKAVQNAIDDCMASTGLHDLYYNFKLGTFVITTPGHGEMLVDELSDGFRSMLSMVADLAYRMVRLNPQLGEKAVEETPGIVLIDEIDMHLHPIWQQTVLLDLQKAFPLVQFIVTTHSPQVLSSVPADSIRVLDWREQEFLGVKRVQFSLGANSTQLLQDIQNVSPRSERIPIVRDLTRYLQLVSEDKWDTPEALELRKELDAWARGNEPALVRADMDIRMRQFRRNRS